MGFSIVFFTSARVTVFFSFAAHWPCVGAQDGYHGEVYYLERTLASGECRGLEGFWKLTKVASTKKTCDDFFVNEFLREKESLMC